MENNLDFTIPVTDALITRVAQELLKKGGKNLIRDITERAIAIKKDEFSPVLFDEHHIAEKILKKSVQTVRRYFTAGILKGKKIGKTWYMTQENLNKYLNDVD